MLEDPGVTSLAGRPETLVILLMDEHALRRAALRRFLEALGEEEGFAIHVAAAGSVEEAAHAAPAPQVALIGCGAVTEAMGLLAELGTCLAHLPVAVLADRETQAEVVAALAGGARGVISTRIDPVLMLHALRFIKAGGHFFPPQALLGEDAAAEPAAAAAAPLALPAGLPAPGGGGLTSRQFEVLRLLQEGQSNKRIARSLGLRESTIKVHVRQIMRKLGVANRTQAALSAMRRTAANDDMVAA